MRDNEQLYDPIYRGPFSVYFGTSYVRYILIDPETRSSAEDRVHRSEWPTLAHSLCDNAGTIAANSGEVRTPRPRQCPARTRGNG